MPLAGAVQVKVQVYEQFVSTVSVQWLKDVAGRALAVGPGPALPTNRRTSIVAPGDAARGSTIGLVVADDETLRDLNRRHRGLDETTDVLSFSFSYQGEYYGDEAPPPVKAGEADFVIPPERANDLGEVIISYPRAIGQAEELGHTIERELAILIVHGTLHLLGYDHMDPADETAMKAKEAEVLAQVLTDG